MGAEKEILLGLIEQKLDWGTSDTWLTKDFESLSQRIFDETGVSLSVSTLRRVWGKVASTHLPSGTTLDTLAKFAGFEDWRFFLKHQSVNTNKTIASSSPVQPAPPLRYWKTAVPLLFGIVILSLTGIIAFKNSKGRVKRLEVPTYRFSSKPLTHDLPNSVIFTYDAHSASTDSVFIQQSWDVRTRTAVDKTLHEFTSIYYEPGFYQAKLIVGNKVVKEHPLLIPTNGWCGIIENQPVPVYLKTSAFISKIRISLPLSSITENNIALQPQPPMVKYFNVGNFEPVPVSGFSFSADVKNEYSEGAAACGMSYVVLITDAVPIVIPLSAKGCVSELNLFNATNRVSGKTADLSAFGVDFSDWVKVSCKSTANSLRYFINERQVYEAPLPAKKVNIVGVGFLFQGTGSVKNIHLSKGDRTIFQAFK